MAKELRDYIDDHKNTRNEMLGKYGRYRADKDSTPILTRALPDYTKINNKMNNDFFGEIVDTKTGYMLGIPIVYSISPDETDAKEVHKLVRKFALRNNIEDLNLETLKMSSVCGYSGRLMYISSKTKKPAIMNIPAWQCIFVYDQDGKDLIKTIRYYRVLADGELPEVKDLVLKEGDRGDTNDGTVLADSTGNDKGTYFNPFSNISTDAVYKTRIEVYDERYIEYYEENVGGTYNFIKKEEHGFLDVPLWEYKNNEERQGDADKAFYLIDAYDRTLSDVNSEIEQFRLAYLALYGLELHDDDDNEDTNAIQRMMQTGAFEMSEDGKIEFITKELADEAVNNHLNRLEKNIVRFAKSVDFSDENFYGNLSGVAIKYKLSKLEHKCKTTEMKFNTADSYMWYLLADYWRIKSVADIDSDNIERIYTRNIPVNMLEEARVQKELLGSVSDETRLANAPFIADAKSEMNKISEEFDSGELKAMHDFYSAKQVNPISSKDNASEVNRKEDRHDDLRPDDRKAND